MSKATEETKILDSTVNFCRSVEFLSCCCHRHRFCIAIYRSEYAKCCFRFALFVIHVITHQVGTNNRSRLRCCRTSVSIHHTVVNTELSIYGVLHGREALFLIAGLLATGQLHVCGVTYDGTCTQVKQQTWILLGIQKVHRQPRLEWSARQGVGYSKCYKITALEISRNPPSNTSKAT